MTSWPWLQKSVRQAFAKGVSNYEQCALDIDPSHLFEHFFGTCAIEASPSIIFEQFMEQNTHTMETKTNWAKGEQAI